MTTMPMAASTNPVNPPASNDPSAGVGNQLNGNDFMTLLIAQLKNQDPTNPMDPTQFVTQLTQFNSLEQLIQINGKLTPPPTPPPTNPSNSTQPSQS